MSTLRWNGPQVAAAIKREAAAGVESAAQHVLGVAVNRTPKDRGDLRQSGRVEADPAEATAAVVFDTPYAVVQHEELNYKHDVGQPKYLESAGHDTATQCRQIIATAIKRGMA